MGAARARLRAPGYALDCAGGGSGKEASGSGANPVSNPNPSPQELVATKLELAELKELQLVTQRQLSRQASVQRTSSMGGRSAAASLGGRSNSNVSMSGAE